MGGRSWLAVVILLASAATAVGDTWNTISSGWRPNRILVTAGAVWASSEGGVLRLDLATRELEVLNVDYGLSGNMPTVIAFDPSTGYLWIGYADAAVDVVDPETDRVVYRIRDFLNDRFIYQVNDIAFGDDAVFIAHTEGLSRLEQVEGEAIPAWFLNREP